MAYLLACLYAVLLQRDMISIVRRHRSWVLYHHDECQVGSSCLVMLIIIMSDTVHWLQSTLVLTQRMIMAAKYFHLTHTHLTALCPGLLRWASAGPYASLHLAPNRNHASIPQFSLLQAGCPSCRPTNSVKALKADMDFHVSSELIPQNFED